MIRSPAPWVAPRGSVGIFDANGVRILLLDSPKRVRPTLDGDAQLIIAAPEMYEALAGLVAAYAPPPGSKVKWWEDARAALAKAEGAS